MASKMAAMASQKFSKVVLTRKCVFSVLGGLQVISSHFSQQRSRVFFQVDKSKCLSFGLVRIVVDQAVENGITS